MRNRLDALLNELARGEVPLRRVGELMWPLQVRTYVLPWGPIWQRVVSLVRRDKRLMVWVEPLFPDGIGGFSLDLEQMAAPELSPDCAKSRLKLRKKEYRASLRLSPKKFGDELPWGAEADPREQWIVSKLKQWFQERVAAWPDDQPAPTEEADWGAARKKFRGVVRDEFRRCREDTTPEPWRTQGRRLPWGKAKLSLR